MDGIVCLSNYQRRLLIEKHGIPKEKTIYIPLGVDISYHKYIPDENRDKFVLSVGRDKGRDYETLIECAKLTPDIDYIIVCSHQNLSRLKQKLPDNVRVFYDMSPQDLKKLYQKAQIMVLSTVDDDNINGMDCSGQTVLLDSMASGLPVIATHKRYLEDYGTHNNEIIITPTSNSLELSNAIIELQASVEKRTKLAESARKRVEKEFTTCLMAKKLAAYFKTFL
jgi:glycosyltransferase involved in cell wall biosynthesis